MAMSDAVGSSSDQGLDEGVLAVAIDTLAAEFDTTLATIQGVATGYTLALATVIPLPCCWPARRPAGSAAGDEAPVPMMMG